MTAGYEEIMETLNAVDGLSLEQKCRRVGLDVEGVAQAGEAFALCTIAAFDPDNDLHDELVLSLAVVFSAGMTLGARLAQAGLADPEPVIA